MKALFFFSLRTRLFFLSFILFLLLLSGSKNITIYAQNANDTILPVSVPQPSGILQVFIPNAYTNDGKLYANILFKNDTSENIADAFYGIQISSSPHTVSTTSGNLKLSTSQPGVLVGYKNYGFFTIKKGESITKQIIYSIDNTVTPGNYNLLLQIRSRDGNIIGYQTQSFSAQGNSTFLQILTQSCHIQIGEKTYFLSDGPVVKPADRPTVNCTVTNPLTTKAEIRYNITYAVGSLAFNPHAQPKTITSSQTIALAPNEKKTISIPLPHITIPQVYEGYLQFKNVKNEIISPLIQFRWTIEGSAASIHSFSTNQPSYHKDDKATVTAWVQASPDLAWRNNGQGTNLDNGKLLVRLIRPDGIICGEAEKSLPKTSKDILWPPQKIPVHITTDCPKFTLSVKVTNNSHELASAQKIYNSPPDLITIIIQNFKQIAETIAVVLLIIFIVLLLRRKRKPPQTPSSLLSQKGTNILAFFFLLFFLGISPSKVLADTIKLPVDNPIDNPTVTQYIGGDSSTYYYANVSSFTSWGGRGTYSVSPDCKTLTLYIYGYAGQVVCSNFSPGIEPRILIDDIPATVTDVQSPDSLVTMNNQCIDSRNGCNFGDNVFDLNNVGAGLRTATATVQIPLSGQTPGPFHTIKVNVAASGRHYSSSGGYYIYDSYMPIGTNCGVDSSPCYTEMYTVYRCQEPPTPTPTINPQCGQSCTKTATNACGQSTTTTGAIMCQNNNPVSCSAIDPIPPPNPAGYGNACSKTSSANSCLDTNTTTGTIQCDGSCSAATPTTPAERTWWNQPCTQTATNACGGSTTSSGVTDCDGICNANPTPPPLPPGYGNACSKTSSVNSCGDTNTTNGTIQCDSSCNAATPVQPPERTFPGGVTWNDPCTKTSAANTCSDIDQTSGNILCDGSCNAATPVKPMCVYGNVYKELNEPPNSTKTAPPDLNFSGISVDLTGQTPANTDATGNYMFHKIAAGNYTVTATAPSGYTTNYTGAPTNPKPVTLTNADVAVNFGIAPGYSISGNIFLDDNKNKIQDGEANYTGTAVIEIHNGDDSTCSVGTLETGVNGTGKITTSNGNFSTSATLLAGQYTVCYIPPTDYTNTYPKNGPPHFFVVTVGATNCNPGSLTQSGASCSSGNVINLRYGITNSVPWFQCHGGDCRIDGGFSNKIQSTGANTAACGGAHMSIPASSQGLTTPGVVFSGGGTADLSPGDASDTTSYGWKVDGTTYSDVFNPTFNKSIRPSYSYLKTRIGEDGTPTNDLLTHCGTNPGNGPSDCELNGLTNGVYTAAVSTNPGGLTLNGPTYTFTGNKNYVIMVNGDLTIKTRILADKGSTVIFVVTGNIYVDSTLGQTSTTTCDASTHVGCDLEGFYVADGSFIIQGNGSAGCLSGGTPDKRLNIAGSIIAGATRTGGDVTNDRDLCIDNLSCPSYSIIQRPDFVINAPDFIRSTSSVWQEKAP